MAKPVDPAPHFLPNSIVPNNPSIVYTWKRSLFYILGSFDTFHDFSKSRSTENEGNSMNPTEITNRVEFTKALINQMDESVPFNGLYDILQMNKSKGDTFENAVFGLFSKTLANPLLDHELLSAYKDDIQTYINLLHGFSEAKPLITYNLKEGSFTAVPLQDTYVSIINITIPAKVYTETTLTIIVNFIQSRYPQSLNNNVLKFVEDAASFPRELFTNHLPLKNRFKKIITPQSKWDPAGVSSFSNFEDI
jgi:hypothetical protein